MKHNFGELRIRILRVRALQAAESLNESKEFVWIGKESGCGAGFED
jgi:hypothetical protein